ncbi:hypothetical protein [Prevotella multiformis]|uniref:Uncharacterized protein n=1 Tax=Prevotella multiformis DSM 16608 TaxID=888743 RepID=F0F5E5_9BACT|nr:hypothetical protein [Prevotella multiformis]EGC20564.1 hypothetical protein HMPREF9141_0811 [Prevotella multiformis DSM 16608]QUB70882.1 hypothetical protein J4864_01260 [Prevotella multiformis]
MRRRLLSFALLLMIPLCMPAQGNIPLLRMPVIDLLQYQVQKGKRSVAPYLFSQYGLRQIQTELVVKAADTRRLWGWHVAPDTDFAPARQPLYRLFAKKDNSSLAVIDDRTGALQIVFWDKAYYRIFTQELTAHGYQLQHVQPARNVLRFQREGVSLTVDITIWSDLYVVELRNR